MVGVCVDTSIRMCVCCAEAGKVVFHHTMESVVSVMWLPILNSFEENWSFSKNWLLSNVNIFHDLQMKGSF